MYTVGNAVISVFFCKTFANVFFSSLNFSTSNFLKFLQIIKLYLFFTKCGVSVFRLKRFRKFLSSAMNTILNQFYLPDHITALPNITLVESKPYIILKEVFDIKTFCRDD